MLLLYWAWKLNIGRSVCGTRSQLTDVCIQNQVKHLLHFERKRRGTDNFLKNNAHYNTHALRYTLYMQTNRYVLTWHKHCATNTNVQLYRALLMLLLLYVLHTVEHVCVDMGWKRRDTTMKHTRLEILPIYWHFCYMHTAKLVFNGLVRIFLHVKFWF